MTQNPKLELGPPQDMIVSVSRTGRKIACSKKVFMVAVDIDTKAMMAHMDEFTFAECEDRTMVVGFSGRGPWGRTEDYWISVYDAEMLRELYRVYDIDAKKIWNRILESFFQAEGNDQ